MDVPLHEDLTDQVALVTGATRGIGEQIAAELTDLGSRVYAGARDTDDITAEAQRAIELDVTHDEAIHAAAERITDEAGRLDVLVNNAGIIGPRGPIEHAPMDELDATLATNLRGPIALTRAMLDLMLETEAPRVVNVSSGAGSFAEGLMTSHGPYAVTKAGLNAFTVTLDAQHADDGLIANSVCPGWVRTDMGGAGAARSVEQGAAIPVWLSRFAPGAPSGRFWRDREPIEW